ncbi:hypothetical protein M0804_011639 [Polistes exclamans]|nr:hypothetical protein M0804_011639 [Polistes exclamans]
MRVANEGSLESKPTGALETLDTTSVCGNEAFCCQNNTASIIRMEPYGTVRYATIQIILDEAGYQADKVAHIRGRIMCQVDDTPAFAAGITSPATCPATR